MNILKLGTLNTPRNRWIDATSVFDIIYVLTTEEEIQLDNPHFIYYKLPYKKNSFAGFLNNFLFRFIRKFKSSEICSNIGIFFLKVINTKFISKIKLLDIQHIHSSYNDFDDSGILTLLISNCFKEINITRAYKETRPEVNIVEKKNFEIADRIVFNDTLNYKFFMDKYPKIHWNVKEIVLGLDEDYRKADIIRRINHSLKYSSTDGSKHVVILTGRAASEPSEKRSGTRIFYIPLIKRLLSKGFKIHLHAATILNNLNGVNEYAKLANEFPNQFFLEESLDFEKRPFESYGQLSKYDFGLLHNINEADRNVSIFDRINIPHRFYEYQNAHVLPFVEKNETLLVEKLINKYNCGVVFNNLNDLIFLDTNEFEFFKPTFEFYIKELYGSKSL